MSPNRDPNSAAKPIQSEPEYEIAPTEFARFWGAKNGTPDDESLDILATLIDAYESKIYPMDPPDPVEAIKFRMEQRG